MRHTVLATILFATILGVSACHKSSGNIDLGSSGNNAAFRIAMAGLGSPIQTFSVDAGTGSTITGAQGTRLHFGPNSFRNSSGAIVSGAVAITLLEIYKPGDMIAHVASTAMRNGTLLTTGGQIFVSATQSGQTLQSNGYDIDFLQPSIDSTAMNLFVGDRDGADSVVVWNEGSGSGQAVVDTFLNFYYRFAAVVRFGWINCDQFAKTPGPKTMLRAYLPGADYNTTNSYVWLIFPDINAATTLGNYRSQPTYYESYTGYEVPVGMRFKMVLVSFQNSKWFYDKQEGVITQGMQITTSPQVTTESAITNNLKNL